MWVIFAATAFLAGLVGGVTRSLDAGGLVLAAAVTTAAAALSWRQRTVRAAGLLTLLIVLGALRATLAPLASTDRLTPLIGQSVSVEGRLVAVPTLRGETLTFTLAVERVGTMVGTRTANAMSSGPNVAASAQAMDEARTQVTIWAAPRGLRNLESGDRLQVEGRLTAPRSTPAFPQAELLRRQGVLTTLTATRVRRLDRAATLDPAAMAGRLRTAIATGFNRYLPEAQASLAAGMLLGAGGGLDGGVRQALQATGLGHVVAVSGYNIVLVGGVVGAIATRLVGRQWALLPALLGITAYTLLAGAPASGVRAALMVSAAMVAGSLGRIADPLTSVTLAAAVMAGVQPSVLLDVGFQLSFAATLGLVLLIPRIGPALAFLPPWLAEPLGLTLAAQLATLPIVLATFQQVSLVAPLANLLVAPLVVLIMAAAALLALVLPMGAVAGVVAWPGALFSAAFLALAQGLAVVPFASVYTGRLEPTGAAGLGVLLLAWGLAPLPELAPIRAGLRRLVPARPAWQALGASSLLALLAGGAALAARPERVVRAEVLAAGSGRDILVRAPRGATVLLVAGDADSRNLAALVGQRLAAWERSLGTVVYLDPASRFAAAETLRRYPADQVLSLDQDLRVELGEGVVLDLFGRGAGPGGAVLAYGDVWLQLAGAAPSPGGTVSRLVVGVLGGTVSPDLVNDASYISSLPGASAASSAGSPTRVASDGRSVWLLAPPGS